MLIKDILMVAVIAIIGSFVMFFIGEITGNTIFPGGTFEKGIINQDNYELTKIIVTPSVVNLGESVEIKVIPGDYGAYKTVYVYEKGSLFESEIDRLKLDCNGFKCTKENGIVKEKYRPENYFGRGDFYVKIKDGSNELVKADFKII